MSRAVRFTDDRGNLAFLSSGTKVHIEAPLTEADLAPHSPEATGSAWGGLGALGLRRTACGLRRVESLAAGRWQRVSWFPDEMLCASCHRALGVDSDLIFEQNQPPGP